MDRIRRAKLQELVKWKRSPCVSLFMPMHVKDRNAMEDLVRLRKLADEAQKGLEDAGLRQSEAEKLLAPLRDLPLDQKAWQHRGRSIAFFSAPGFHQIIHNGAELKPLVHVSDQFYFLPLVPHMMDSERFFVLAISQNRARFFEGDGERLHEESLAGIPKNLEAAIDIEYPEHGQRYHSGDTGSRGKQMALHHGQGGKPEVIKDDMRQFLQQIAAVVDKRLRNERAPLVLATVESTVPMWRETSDYKFLLDDIANGNPDHLSPAQLHAKVWPLVKPALGAYRKWCEERLATSHGTKLASSLREIVPAAISGRISALFIDCKRSRWGRYDPANNAVVLHMERQPGDQDLIELAAVETMRNGGDVFDLQPKNGDAGESAEALLRF
jgi:Bacterial archaeo-eukaryotic release factor family 3